MLKPQADLQIQKRPTRIRFPGRVLFLTEDPQLLRRQLDGDDLDWTPDIKLRDNISTDEITPGWVCYNYDEKLARYALIGLKGGAIKEGDVADGGFVAVVSGKSKGCGSSRENAPYAEYWAGIRVVIAENIEKIYGQNCQNIGLLTSTDFALIDKIRAGEEIDLTVFTDHLDPISRDVVEHGSLFNYNVARARSMVTVPALETAARPMTLVEKIIAKNAVTDAEKGTTGVPYVKPGDSCFVRTNVRFSHEYVTPMAVWLFRKNLRKTPLTDPGSIHLFRDHLLFLGKVMPEKQRQMGLLDKANGLADEQKAFAQEEGIHLYDGTAICHNAVVEDLALPGTVTIGSDSHTCMAGVLGSFAFGVGTTDLANSWFTKDLRVKVPETIKFVLKVRLKANVAAKDVMLKILSMDYVKNGDGIGQVMEFAGPGLACLEMDERATLANMAVEAGGFTGIVEPDEMTVQYLLKQRGLSRDEIAPMLLRADPEADYAQVFELDLDTLEPQVAPPSDPRNGMAMSELTDEVRLDIAYGGSCTGGKMADMDMYAAVLKRALDDGKKVADGTRLYIQFGSDLIKRYAESKGYIEIFEHAGAELIDPACGACIRAGPGASMREDEVVVSAQNRNFPGRSGPGQMYLASPYTVAASAVAGHLIAAPDDLVQL